MSSWHYPTPSPSLSPSPSSTPLYKVHNYSCACICKILPVTPNSLWAYLGLGRTISLHGSCAYHRDFANTHPAQYSPLRTSVSLDEENKSVHGDSDDDTLIDEQHLEDREATEESKGGGLGMKDTLIDEQHLEDREATEESKGGGLGMKNAEPEDMDDENDELGWSLLKRVLVNALRDRLAREVKEFISLDMEQRELGRLLEKPAV